METLERNNGSLEKEVAMDMILRQLQELNNRFDGMTSESDNTFQLLSPIPYVPIQVREVEQEACQFKEQSSPLLGLYEETNTVQQVGIDGALQMESPIVKTEDNQANFIIKDENSRSAPCEQKGHFLDSFSIKCSNAYYDSTKSVHKRDITIIEDALIIESPIHVQNSDLLEHSKTSFENFIFLPYDIIHIQRSFHLILSCDFPPDIGRLCSIEYDSFKFALESRVENNHDLILSHKHSHVFIHEILSCDIPLDLNIHEKDHLTCMVFIDCISANCGSSLKVLNLHSSLQHQTATYTLEPLPVDLEPPPKKSYQREWTIVKKFQILIRDENFCYKSLKRFHYTVVPFLPLLT